MPAPKPPSERESLILAHFPLVRTIAGRLIRRLPSSVELNELVQEGALGLIEAADSFEADRGVPFKAFAEIRIQGRMLDYLRKIAWVTRATRRRNRIIEEARLSLRESLNREPSREEMAEKLDMTLEAYDDLVASSAIYTLLSIDTPVDPESGSTLVDVLPAEEGDDPTAGLNFSQERELARSAIEILPSREKFVVEAYYLKGWTLASIGEYLGVTEARACQIKAAGMKTLAKKLRAARCTPAERRLDEELGAVAAK